MAKALVNCEPVATHCQDNEALDSSTAARNPPSILYRLHSMNQQLTADN